jgi:hypothetical protein
VCLRPWYEKSQVQSRQQTDYFISRGFNDAEKLKRRRQCKAWSKDAERDANDDGKK